MTAAHDFYSELFFYSFTTACLLWMPVHCAVKIRKRKPLTRRHYVEMSILCVFTLIMMNIECLPGLIRKYHEFQEDQAMTATVGQLNGMAAGRVLEHCHAF